MSEIDAFEQRQWRLIRDLLDSYDHSEIDFEHLVSELNALSTVLSGRREDLRKELRGHWWTLEQLLAAGLDRGDVATVLIDNRPMLDDALRQLRRMVEEADSENA